MSYNLTRGQKIYRDTLARATGLDRRVIHAWLFSEENGAAAQQYEKAGNYNFLNIGPGRKYTTPQQGALAAAKVLKTAGFYKGILAARGNPQAQIAALVASPWDAGHYHGGAGLRTITHAVSGQYKLPTFNGPTSDTRNHVPRAATAPSFDPGGVTTSTDRQGAIEDAILKHGQHGNSFSKQLLYDLGSGNYTKTNVRQAKYTPGTQPNLSAHPNAAAGPGEVFIAKGADRPGVATSNEIKHLLGLVAGGYGHPLTVTTGTNHNRMTVDGNVSDHWTGHAADIAVPVDSHKGDQIAYHALRTAGMSHEAAVQAVHTGGLFNLNWHGHRVQIIWKTNIGGNHHNHVHVGIR